MSLFFSVIEVDSISVAMMGALIYLRSAWMRAFVKKAENPIKKVAFMSYSICIIEAIFLQRLQQRAKEL